jgi:hypothetical protein
MLSGLLGKTIVVELSCVSLQAIASANIITRISKKIEMKTFGFIKKAPY